MKMLNKNRGNETTELTGRHFNNLVKFRVVKLNKFCKNWLKTWTPLQYLKKLPLKILSFKTTQYQLIFRLFIFPDFPRAHRIPIQIFKHFYAIFAFQLWLMLNKNWLGRGKRVRNCKKANNFYCFDLKIDENLNAYCANICWVNLWVVKKNSLENFLTYQNCSPKL